MSAADPTRPRLRPKFTGLFTDETEPHTVWLRERAIVRLPALTGVRSLRLTGTVLPADPADPAAAGPLGLTLRLPDGTTARHHRLPEGGFDLTLDLPAAAAPAWLELRLAGVAAGNWLAWLGRLTKLPRLQTWRRQARNRRLRLARLEADGEVLFDFGNRASPWNSALARRHLRLGLNVLGYFRADLGIGESARCMARAADAAGLPAALIDLRLPCKNPMGDTAFAARLQADNPHAVNVVHVDPPGMRDLDHHHPGFRRGKHTIGYWAWELPEFPDAWIHFSDYCDEVWAPSQFAAAAIAEKVPVPVLAMPHAVAFDRPDPAAARARFGLPAENFLFLFLYDLNSYSARKNPGAVLDAFRRSGLAARGAALVIKVHNAAGNPGDFSRLRAEAAELPGTTLITETLPRADLCALEAACDCFVSLHRAEGFGLAVAECMYLGKPVISTDWSATAEFVTPENGCPVRATTVILDRNHGPYAKGQMWAEPDVAHAAEWMERLFADRALAARLGAAARRTIEERFAPAVIGARYRRRLEAIAGW